MTAAVSEKKTPKTKKEKALVIVESPAKSKTIKKILGDGYQIEASFGHVRNLPENVLGFDVNNGFKPTYVIIPEKKKVVTKLNELAKRSDKIYLASDPDREGEAIAWHVRELLEVPDDKVFRIEFNEITPKAVKYAVEHSRQIDMDKVKAQQTRQILDKLVGYKLSPVLWKQLGNYRLSAGRVQSVALRMICEREEEIEAFVPKEYWSIHTIMDKDGKLFEAEVNKYKNKKIEINNEEEANKIKEFLLNPDTEFEVDYSLSEYRSKYHFDDGVLTISYQDKSPYGNTINVWNIYLTEWINRFISNPSFLQANNLSYLRENIKSSDIILGYEVIQYDVIIKCK